MPRAAWRIFCAGYFKWPIPNILAPALKLLFSNLLAAVTEIEDDLSGPCMRQLPNCNPLMNRRDLQRHSSSDVRLQCRLRLLL